MRRVALRFEPARPLLEGRLNVGVNAMIASGWTGQTTETFASASVFGPGKVGIGRGGLVAGNPVREVVGVRVSSYASLSINYCFAASSTR